MRDDVPSTHEAGQFNGIVAIMGGHGLALQGKGGKHQQAHQQGALCGNGHVTASLWRGDRLITAR